MNRKGFTLVEMLVVIGIIMILAGATIGGLSFAVKRAQQARARELISNTATALNVMFQRQQRWPPSLLTESKSSGLLTAQAAACLAVNGYMSLSHRSFTKDGETVYELSGFDRCGIVTPWATDVIKKHDGSGLGTKVPSGGKVQDHLLHFALDDDGDGITEAKVGGQTVKVRANAVVWCWGRNGKEDDYQMSMAGRGDADDLYSWSKNQEARQ